MYNIRDFRFLFGAGDARAWPVVMKIYGIRKSLL